MLDEKQDEFLDHLIAGIHDNIYVELKKDLDRIAIILEEILKQVSKK